MRETEKAIENLNIAKNILCNQQMLTSEMCIRIGQAITDAISLLKEQETKYPVCEKCGKKIDHIITSVFNYDGSDSDYSIPITYRKENGCASFSTSQNWTGYDLTDEERKEGICCPYCRKFPFDDGVEIEFYEPVEVLMWTSEGGEVEWA